MEIVKGVNVLSCCGGIGLIGLLFLAVKLAAAPRAPTRQGTQAPPTTLRHNYQYSINTDEPPTPASAYHHQGERWQNYCRIMKPRQQAPITGETGPVRVQR